MQLESGTGPRAVRQASCRLHVIEPSSKVYSRIQIILHFTVILLYCDADDACVLQLNHLDSTTASLCTEESLP